ncbi:MAG: LysR family transcriptional regulator [Gammaproteobacteria bacterium]|nr:MAG: LysR family transcriptional regulator [Gammaproteobacteria bacterium]
MPSGIDKFTDFQAFVTVVERGSFTAAAEQIGLAKSMISRRISKLESHLGAKLLNRTTRRLSLTDSGRAFYARAVRILADVEEAEQTVCSQQTELHGRIRIAAPLSFAVGHLTPAITEFLIEYPELHIDLDLNDRQINLVEEGFDLAVRIGQLQDSTLVARRLSMVRRVAVASPDYLVRHGTPGHPSELKQHAGLNYTNMPRHQQWQFVLPDGQTLTPQVSFRLQANNGELLARAAEGGLGIAVLPTFIVYRAITQGRLRAILTDYESPSEGLFAVYPPGRFLSRRVRLFSDYLANRFGDRPYWDECVR